MLIASTLVQINSHPRDIFIAFEALGHKYTIKGLPSSPSVTTVAHKYFPEFNADEVIKRMMKKKFRTDKYIGLTPDQIKETWEKTKNEALFLGVQLHAQIEDYLNGERENIPTSPEFNQFLNFWSQFQTNCPNLQPYRTEWLIYDDETLTPGCIDFCLKDEHGRLYLIDWKRSKEIKEKNPYQKGFGPCAHLDDCNFNHYSIQLNLYQWILEKNYNVKVAGRILAIFHPNQDNYKLMWIQEMQDLINKIMNF